MEWALPLQKLELSKIRLGTLTSRPPREKKPLIPLAYVDSQMTMPVLTILLPHMTVDSYNSANGRLILTIDAPWISTKLTSLQNSLLGAVSNSQASWFGKKQFSMQEVCDLFQPMIEGNKLHLYCPSTIVEKRKGSGTIKLWKDDAWIEGVRPGLLSQGNRVRVAIQLQGLSLQLGASEQDWTGRSRLQHRVLCIFVKSASKPTTPPSEAQTPPPQQLLTQK